MVLASVPLYSIISRVPPGFTRRMRNVPESAVSSFTMAVWSISFRSAENDLSPRAVSSMRAARAVGRSAVRPTQAAIRSRKQTRIFIEMLRIGLAGTPSGTGKRHVSLDFLFRIEDRLHPDQQLRLTGARAEYFTQFFQATGLR